MFYPGRDLNSATNICHSAANAKSALTKNFKTGTIDPWLLGDKQT